MSFRFSKAGAAWAIGLGAIALTACQSSTNVGGAGGGANVGAGGAGGGGTGGSGAGEPLPKADKVDIVLMVDNSRSMADKQEVLSVALNDLVFSLTNPPCVDPTGAQPPQQPAGPQDACPAGLVRWHLPVQDIHLGIISSSIGGHGADICPANSPELQSNNDRAHLLARSNPTASNDIATYDGKGFLSWDPGGKYNPPGESDPTALASTFSQMVRGVGQVGCGYESQLESWYRFLADPEPYESISVVGAQAVPQGIDSALLQQRADFLRPDSMLVVLMLTDENDCSIRESGQFYFAAQVATSSGSKFHLPRPRAVCATNPNDPCCHSCGQPLAAGCAEDPTCYINGDPNQGIEVLDDMEDAFNVRCFDQKRRFGIDFLYPVDRYVQALTSPMVTNRAGEPVPNPIFSDLNPSDANTNIRDPGLVVLGGIVGVPWQDIARDPSNLGAGLKSAEELTQSGTWDVILGDPASHVPPTSPYMVESIDPRSGVMAGNAVNGNEWTIPGREDLQYACIFDLPVGAERDCSEPGAPACDCQPGSDNPLCADDSGTGETTLQVAAKAYPGLRELSVLKGLGPQGVTASICPAQLSAPTLSDYGYRPAIRSLLERMAPRL